MFYEENDYTERFFEAIRFRIRDRNNYVLMFYGEPNLGKSEGGGFTGKFTKKEYQEITGKKNRIHLGFSTMEFDKIIRDMEEGDIGIRDESPKGSGKGSRTIEQNLDNITQIVRAAQNFFIFICPKRIETDVVTYYLEAAGKNKEERKLRFILYDPTFKEGKIPIGRIFIPLHDDEEFRKEYERRKHANIGLIKKKGGAVYYEIDAERLSQDFKKLYEYCKLRNTRTKTDIKTQLSNFNIEKELEDKPEECISGDIDYNEKLIQNVYKAFKHPESLPKYLLEFVKKDLKKKIVTIPIQITGTGFIPFLEKYYEENLPETIMLGTKPLDKKGIVKVLSAWASGIGIRDIAHSLDDLSQPLTQDIIKLFKDGKRHATKISDEWRTYRAYEHYCAQKYGLELISGQSQPDFRLKIGDKEIPGEIKLWDDIKRTISLDKRKKFHSYDPEGEDGFPVIWRNVKWGDKDFLYIVPNGGSFTFNFENNQEQIINSPTELISLLFTMEMIKSRVEVKKNGKKEGPQKSQGQGFKSA